MDVQQHIEQFCHHFRDQVRIVGALSIDVVKAEVTDQENHQIRFYQKVVLISLIDTLAGVRYPNERYPQLNKRNHDRFITFLSDNDIWPDGQLVSVPFMKDLEATGKLTDGKLKEVVVQKHQDNFEDGSFNIDYRGIDLNGHELLKICTTEQEEKAVRDNVHYELLYRYRNYLVHEARVPGNAMEVTSTPEPYYHGYIDDEQLYLAYPLEHFINLADKSIKVVESYLTENQINPYDFVKETTRW